MILGEEPKPTTNQRKEIRDRKEMSGGRLPAGHKYSQSECYSPGKLHDARQVVLATHLTKATSPASGRIELGSVEQVEKLTPELEPESTIRTKLHVLERGEVK